VSVNGKTAASLVVYGLAHAVIDAISSGILLTLWWTEVLTYAETGALFVLYNLLAFGAQPVLGLLVDWSQRPRAAAILGCGLTASATVVFLQHPLLGVILTGLGNAIFHLGAGSICLQLTPGRALAPGIFVAPGDLGIFLGTYLGKAGVFVAWPFVLGLAGLCVAMVLIPLPAIAYARPKPAWKWATVVVVLLLVCVGVRSLVGFSLVLPWKSVIWLALIASVSVTLGKALGGVFADRLGWGRIAVGALAVAAPLLAFGAGLPGVALAGLFLFNLTMPVTLTATANLLPGRPAFAFGLTCLALELGAWTVLQHSDAAAMCGQPWYVFAVIVGSAVVLYVALRTAFRRLPAFFAGVHE
jgi:FSR family fosmidomycin resistance protein-like MFS transporter